MSRGDLPLVSQQKIEYYIQISYPLYKQYILYNKSMQHIEKVILQRSDKATIIFVTDCFDEKV